MVKGHVIFDFDGTVVDSYHAVISGIQEVLGQELERSIDLEEIKKKYDPHLPVLMSNFGLSAEDRFLVKRLAERWSALAVERPFDYKVFPGIKELVSELKREQLLTHLWTARDRASTLKIKRELGIENLFNDFRCGDDTKTKPDPEGIQSLVGEFPPNRVVVIGDSHMDIMGAKEFGCHFIGAMWCQSADRQKVTSFGPDHLADGPLDCMTFIRKVLL